MSAAQLIVICGPPCCGKSTLAAALQDKSGFVHLEMDRILAQVLPGATYAEAERDLGYRVMHLAAGFLLRAGPASSSTRRTADRFSANSLHLCNPEWDCRRN